MISNLGRHRAEKHEDATKWSPREAVSHALDLILGDEHPEVMIVLRKDTTITTISSGVTTGSAVEILKSALKQLIT